MALTTKLFSVLPWRGGLNTSQNPAMIEPNQLTRADGVSMGEDFSKQRRKGINFDWDSASSAAAKMVGLHDFWYGVDGRDQVIVGVDSDDNIYTYNSSGTRTTRNGGTAWASAITTVNMLTFNNRCLIAVDGAGNVMKQLDATSGLPATATDLSAAGGTPPQASCMVEHLGRVVTNDKTNVDRIHFCETSNVAAWGVNNGDGGALDIRPGDGDPEGIVALGVYKGDLIVFKSTKIYRVISSDPETFQIIKISDSIGCVGPNAVADIDGNDLVFVSKRGIHSLQVTEQFGDLKQAYLSRDIQKSFKSRWERSLLRAIHARYLPSENSVAFCLTDQEFSSDENRAIWWYNIEDKSWYRWPDISCASISRVEDSDRERMYIGTNTTRVAQAFTVEQFDTSEAGAETGVTYELDTGFIDVESSPFILKDFKSIGLVFAAEGTYNVTVAVKVDNKPEQLFVLSDANPGDLLGVDFVLGVSSLGVDGVMAAHMAEHDMNGEGFGSGKYIRLRISMSGATEFMDLQGFLIEYEVSGDQKEVINAND